MLSTGNVVAAFQMWELTSRRKLPNFMGPRFFLGSKHSATFPEVSQSVSPATGLGLVGVLGLSFGTAGPDLSGPVNFHNLQWSSVKS